VVLYKLDSASFTTKLEKVMALIKLLILPILYIGVWIGLLYGGFSIIESYLMTLNIGIKGVLFLLFLYVAANYRSLFAFTKNFTLTFLTIIIVAEKGKEWIWSMTFATLILTGLLAGWAFNWFFGSKTE
jgi:hypothetical protein